MARVRKYDPMENEPEYKPEASMSMNEWFTRDQQIKAVWFGLFGQAEDYDITFFSVMNHLNERILKNVPKLTDELIEEKIWELIDRDDWAYEHAYHREREYPPEPKQIGFKGTRRKIRKSKTNPLQICWDF